MAKRYIGKGAKAQASVRAKNIAKLRSLGLITKSQGKTVKSRQTVLRKFRDVLANRAAVVTVPKSEARKLRKGFKARGNKIVVPRQKGERIRVDAQGRITSTRKVGGERVKRILHLGGKIPKPRKGKKFLFAIPFANGGRVRFDSMKALQEFMQPYEDKTYKDWRNYLEIEEVDADKDEGDDEE